MGKKQYEKLYIPAKKVEDYLPYFKLEKDDKVDYISYLLRDVKIDIDSELGKLAIEGVGRQYTDFDSEMREGMEQLFNLKFEYSLNVNQTNTYKLVMDDVAKEYVSKATLNIAIVDGVFDEMILVLADGSMYGNADTIDMISKEDKAFIDDLVKKKLLKKKRENVSKRYVDIPLEDVISTK